MNSGLQNLPLFFHEGTFSVLEPNRVLESPGERLGAN